MNGVPAADLSGRTAYITGAGRGQGRAHAVRLASLGADVIAVDICSDMPGFSYPMASRQDLLRTRQLVQDTGRRASVQIADVRDLQSQETAFRAGLDDLGRDAADIVIANAGAGVYPPEADDPAAFGACLQLMLTGPWNTLRVTTPPMITAGQGGAVVLTGSSAALAGFWGGTPGADGYTAAKAGLIGLMRVYANLLGPHAIRVNSIHPTGVRSGMTENESFAAFVGSMIEQQPIATRHNVIPLGMLEPADVSDAVAWLVSDQARYVTGVALPVDAGFVNS